MKSSTTPIMSRNVFKGHGTEDGVLGVPGYKLSIYHTIYERSLTEYELLEAKERQGCFEMI